MKNMSLHPNGEKQLKGLQIKSLVIEHQSCLWEGAKSLRCIKEATIPPLYI